MLNGDQNYDVGPEKTGEENKDGDDSDTDAIILPFVSGRSPRYEAFVMTGEKMLRLNPKISPNYAKLKKSELPKHTEILGMNSSSTSGRRDLGGGPPFSDLEANAADPFYRSNTCTSSSSTKTKCKFLQEHAALLRALNEQQSPVSQSENVLIQQNLPNGVGARQLVGRNGTSQGAPRAIPETPSQSLRSDSEGGNLQDGSLVTVHGRLCPSDTDTDTGKSYVVLSDDDGRHRRPKHAGPINELPSPVSPVFLSEPVTPAKGAFTATRAIFDDLQPSSSDYQIDGDETNAKTSKFTSQSDFDDGKCTAMPCSSSFMSTLPPFSPPTNRSSGKDSLKHKPQIASSSSISFRNDNNEAAKRLARRLYMLDGFTRQDVAKHLANNNDFGAAVANEYLKFFNFAGLRIDAALRKFLFNFSLTGETAERARILSFFSRRYHESNPSLFGSEDDVHTLACALLLLNTDLHGQNLSKHMSSREFISNLTQAGRTYPMDLLKSLFQSVKYSPIECANDLNSQSTNSRFVSINRVVDDRFLSIPDLDSQIEYKKGWVMRKCIIDNDGKRMPFGRRSWRMFYATLKGMILYLHKDELGFRKGSVHFSRNSIRIHHSLAVKASDYAKKQHVFRLHTASLAEYLFQTSDPNELQDWINNINFVAACFSSPSLPGALSAKQSFHRPFYSSAPSKLSFKEQLEMHEARVVDTHKQLSQHRLEAPGRSAKPRVLQEYAEKEIFLIFELERYSVYAKLLRSKHEELGISTSSFFKPDAAPPYLTDTCRNIAEMEDVDPIAKIPAAVPVEDPEQKGGQVDRYSYRAAINDCMTVPTPEGGYETTF